MENIEHRYDFVPELINSTRTYNIQLRMVPQGAFVLDIGCHTGIFGQALTEIKKAKVVGIDNDANAVDIAKLKIADAFTSDIEIPGWTADIRRRGYLGFDAIILGDVLEHTRNPESILREARALLNPQGLIIVSIPNIAYWNIRILLLLGKFEYRDTGTLDRTHLRFYTHKTARELLERSGLAVVEDDVSGIPLPKMLFRISLPHWLLRMFPGLLGFQYVAAASATAP